MVKWRGDLPKLGTFPTSVSFPLAESTENSAMLSAPRLDVYTNLPLGWTAISAAVFSPEKSGGREEIFWIERKVSLSLAKTVTVE